jgi:flagellar biosynthetic protein FlhB
MAENDGQEKTEQPTGKKLEDAREKGQVAKSMEINSFAIFTSGLLIIFAAHQFMGDLLGDLAITIFTQLDTLTIDQNLIQIFASKGFLKYVLILFPIFLGLVIIAVAASASQVGIKISLKAMEPKFSKLNPLKGIKEKFFSSRSFVEAAKSIVKLIIIGVFIYNVLEKFFLQSVSLVSFTIPEIVDFMIESAISFLWQISLAFAVIAIADFVFQKYKFKKDMMMTKHEVKEEGKQTEGSPEIKSRIKKEQMLAAKKRMMSEIPNADVVITNPTHYAVALKYDMDNESAPKVVAKGVDTLAQRIKKIAAEHDVPIHENKVLARALYKYCDVGDSIPEKLFHAVAQILAFIYQSKNEKGIV